MDRLNPSRRAWSFLLLAASLGQTPSRAETPADPDVEAKAEAYLADRVKNDDFSGAVLIARDGKPVFRRGYGMANRELDVPNTPETKFRLGSLTKQFTAMAVMILQERGKLDVHEKVKTYVPDAPEAWDEVTVHHLLTHTSGIPSFTSQPDYGRRMAERTTLDGLIARFKDKPLEFAPGSRFAYSNSGYVLLGKVIETASGRNYSSFLRESIFQPLGMKDSGYDSPTPILKQRASGYARPFFVVVNAPHLDMSIPHAAGALYSTVDDLLKWDRALGSEALVSRSTLDRIFTPEKNNYGYGWVVVKAFGRPMVTHAGGINGFVTDIRRFPDDKLCVVVLSNLETTPVSQIGADLAAIALGEAPSSPRPTDKDNKPKDSGSRLEPKTSSPTDSRE